MSCWVIEVRQVPRVSSRTNYPKHSCRRSEWRGQRMADLRVVIYDRGLFFSSSIKWDSWRLGGHGKGRRVRLGSGCPFFLEGFDGQCVYWALCKLLWDSLPPSPSVGSWPQDLVHANQVLPLRLMLWCMLFWKWRLTWAQKFQTTLNTMVIAQVEK